MSNVHFVQFYTHLRLADGYTLTQLCVVEPLVVCLQCLAVYLYMMALFADYARNAYKIIITLIAIAEQKKKWTQPNIVVHDSIARRHDSIVMI